MRVSRSSASAGLAAAVGCGLGDTEIGYVYFRNSAEWSPAAICPPCCLYRYVPAGKFQNFLVPETGLNSHLAPGSRRAAKGTGLVADAYLSALLQHAFMLMEQVPAMQYLVAGALGLGLAACSGFRVFVPLLAASIAYHTGYLAPAAGFAWLGSWAALLTLATATVVEVAGYYVPVVDHLLDTLTTPASFVAGTILMTSALPHLDPTLRWTLGLLVGGGTAGLVQTGTALLRGASTATTGGLANPVLATAENTLAVGGVALTLLLPLVAAGLVLLLVGYILSRLRRWRARRRSVARQ